MIAAITVAGGDLTNSADAFRLGYVGRPGQGQPERTDPANVRRPQAVDPPVFPRDPVGAGFKLVRDRLMRFGGMFGTPAGPSPYAIRPRAKRGPMPAGPETVARTLDPRTPAGLVKTDPTYESYLTGPDGYLA